MGIIEDFKMLENMNRELRRKRFENFEDNWLEKLKQKTKLTKRANGSYTFDSHLGVIDYYPKANKLLIRNTNKWKKPGLKFIVKNIINGKQSNQ